MLYFWDTNILVHFMANSPTYQSADNKFDFFSPDNLVYISIVSKAEMLSIALRNGWGETKMKILGVALDKFHTIPIERPDIVSAYADIDAYSQGDHPDIPTPPNFSARNMGKNDLWIAATASVFGARLITTDKDFAHLKTPHLVDVEVIPTI